MSNLLLERSDWRGEKRGYAPSIKYSNIFGLLEYNFDELVKSKAKNAYFCNNTEKPVTMIKIDIKENSSERIEIALKGEMDTLAAKTFAAEMEAVMAEAGRRITLDFRELEYISSAGMRTVLLLQKTADGKGGKVCIKGMSEEIRQVFCMTGFDQIIEIL